ncbi:hypothetical protein CQW49_07575 [Methylosinus trichosporium OB3b]|uniref:Uncharacterized protein n=1 Tax=Methylosinus trichosporium (strain ATCC 35070 / NCIMB 11131 / UNIQEM 75 / OB3b) TaxID=595536 RepID=A0A2D2CYE6_METT3|nr:hypothetical protein CQW49_07575 [Methylosinus trichosporium OB3b]OBS51787.1 hypothetical protein A8B73_14080 [Methylosinus sp. 3S-1]
MGATMTHCGFDLSSQHDMHCWIIFDHRQRWIIRKHGDILATTCEDGPALINLSCVDWETYTFVALEMLRRAFPDCSLTYENSLAALNAGETLDANDL